MTRRLAAVAWLTAVVATHPCVAIAQSDPGIGRDALPSLVRVGVAGSSEPGLGLAGTAGWGLTEAQGDEGGAHHRLGGTVAAAITPVEALSVALRLDGRYDNHPDGDDGWIGAPSLAVRGGHSVGAVRLGAEAALTIPGAEFPSLVFDAPVVDLRALGAVDLAPLLVAAHVGYRIDRSAAAIDEPQRLGPGDRLALGLSDFDALLLGLGVAYELGPATLLLEGTWDLLLGAGAPAASESPIRVSGGVRYRATEAVSVELVVDASPSGRAEVLAAGPLFPVEPRLGVWVGARWRLPWAETPPPAAQEPAQEAPAGEPAGGDAQEQPQQPQEPQEPELPSGELRGMVRSFNGRPVVARVTVEPAGDEPLPGGEPLRAETDDDGFFEIDVPPGAYEVTIEASGYREQRRRVTVEENGVTILNADLRRARRR